MGKKITKKVYKTSPPDYFYISLVFALTIFGFMMLSSASSDLEGNYLQKQFINLLIIGIPGVIAGLLIPYNWLKKAAVPFLIISVVFLVLVFVPSFSMSAKGASRWIDLGFFTFQPGELIKLSIIIFFSAWLAGNKERAKSLSKGFLPFVFILGVVMALLVMQPSTTMALIIAATCLIIYFVNGLSFKHFLSMVVIGLVALSILISVTDYRFERITSFYTHLIGQEDKEFSRDAGFQLRKTLFAIKSGGLYGVGFGNSATKTSIPEVQGDSIFAVVAEEFGFLGSFALISVFGVLIWRGFYIAKHVSDNFGKTLIIGFSSILAIQSIINIGAISGFLPLTGVPLPFISFGGTALAVFLTMSGIIVNISMYRR